MAGLTLGTRTYFDYTDDSGATFSIQTLTLLGLAGGLVASTVIKPSPRRFHPRGCYAEATVGGADVRKFIPCSSASTIYASDSSASVTIDSTAFKTTGRRGEKFSFGRNP